VSFTKCDNFKYIEETKYILLEDVVWEIGRKGSNLPVTLPAGYIFDISVPKGLTWVQDPHDRKVLLAACLHDWLLDNRFDIAFASAEFRRACIARGVSKLPAWMLFSSTYLYLSGKHYIKQYRN